jgi:hypothetical protein
MLADPQSVLNTWKNFFNQVLNIQKVHDVRQMYTQMAEPLVANLALVKWKLLLES